MRVRRNGTRNAYSSGRVRPIILRRLISIVSISSALLLPRRHSSRVLGSADPYAFRKPPRSSAHFKASRGVDQRAAVQIDNAIHSYSVTRFRLSLLYA